MKLPRRNFLHLAAGAAALPAVSRTALALDYPTRPVHVVVSLPAGTPPDIVARMIGQSLSERLGQPFIITDRPGGSTTIGSKSVAHAAPDGYTILLMMVGNEISVLVDKDPSFNFVRDIAPIARIGGAPFFMLVNTAVRAKTVPELIAYAKANPGKINMASTGHGTASHVFGELFMMMTGIKLLHVPYRTNFMPDLLAGQVQLSFIPISNAVDHVHTGALRALAVTTATRVAAFPAVPTIAEFVPGYEASGWFGIGAPAKTPADIIDKLSAQINTAVADPAMKARLVNLGVEPMSMTAAAFGKFIADEGEKWAKVIKFANIKPE